MSDRASGIKGIQLDDCCFNRCKKLVECKYNTVTSLKFLRDGTCAYFQIVAK
jgi:hypothetical protein